MSSFHSHNGHTNGHVKSNGALSTSLDAHFERDLAVDRGADHFHIRTPLIHSAPISKLFGRDVYLKLDNLQPSGSFKIRGIGPTCAHAVRSEGRTWLVGSSAGNAGMAMAVAARRLDVPLVVFIPECTEPLMLDLLRLEGAEVRVVGKNWNEANEAALALAADDPQAFFVHPFNQPSTWEGHASVVHEIAEQLQDEFGVSRRPACLVTVVGGGGLALGIALGLRERGWNDVPVLCMETRGADCLNQAVKAGRPVTLPGITSIASSLGARTVEPTLLEFVSQSSSLGPPMHSHVTSDRSAVSACLRFANDHRLMVEPACGAALDAVYAKGAAAPIEQIIADRDGPVVVEVCGGNKATLGLYEMWKKQLNLEAN